MCVCVCVCVVEFFYLVDSREQLLMKNVQNLPAGSVDYWLQDLKVLFLITVKQVEAAEVFNQQLGLVGGPK